MYIEVTRIGLNCTHSPLEKCTAENTTIIKGKMLIEESHIISISEQPKNSETYSIGVRTSINVSGEKIFLEDSFEKVKALVSAAASQRLGLPKK